MLEQRILEGLFRQNYHKMTHLASVLLGNDEEAEDVVQDVSCVWPTATLLHGMTAIC